MDEEMKRELNGIKGRLDGVEKRLDGVDIDHEKRLARLEAKRA